MIEAEEWLDMRSMYKQGMAISEIARRTGHDRKTVRRHVQSDTELPRYKKREGRPSILEPFKEYIDQRIEERDWSTVRLLEDVRGMGYEGGYTLVREYARMLRRAGPPGPDDGDMLGTPGCGRGPPRGGACVR
jgi:transposase